MINEVIEEDGEENIEEGELFKMSVNFNGTGKVVFSDIEPL